VVHHRWLRVADADTGNRPQAMRACVWRKPRSHDWFELEPTFHSTTHWEIAGRLTGPDTEDTGRSLHAHLDGSLLASERSLQHDSRAAARSGLRSMPNARRSPDMRHSGEIGDEVFRNMQYDIDLAESRLLATNVAGGKL